ncbi:MAG: hypothetical protein AB7N76_19095 [Planctomycetota bacterium]
MDDPTWPREVLELDRASFRAQAPAHLRWVVEPGPAPAGACFVPTGLFGIGLTLLGLAFTLPLGVACLASPLVLLSPGEPLGRRALLCLLGVGVAWVCWRFNAVLAGNVLDHLRHLRRRYREGLFFLEEALVIVRASGAVWVLPRAQVARVELSERVKRLPRDVTVRKLHLEVTSRDARAWTTELEPSLALSLALRALPARLQDSGIEYVARA